MTAKFIKLAFKNIARNRRRTGLTALITIFGSVALILAGGFMKYTFWGLAESSIRREYGHLQIFNPHYLDKEEDAPLQYGLERADSLVRVIQSFEPVRFAMPRISFTGLISNGDKSVAFLGRAVAPEKEQKLAGFSIRMDEGHHLGEDIFNPDKDEVILAKGLAKSLKAGIGDYMTIMTTTTSGALNAVDVKVVGIFSTGVAEIDERLLNIKLTTSQWLLNTDRVSNIVVVLKDTDATDRAAEELAPVLADFRIRKWYEMASFYRAVVKLYTNIFGFLGVLIFVVVLLASSNTMMMAVLERTSEIGTLMAIGASACRILANFLLEGLILGGVAAAAGIILALLFSFAINNAGITMPPPPGSTTGYPLSVKYVLSIYAGTFILMLMTSVLSAFFPALRASRLKIVDALGHV